MTKNEVLTNIGADCVFWDDTTNQYIQCKLDDLDADDNAIILCGDRMIITECKNVHLGTRAEVDVKYVNILETLEDFDLNGDVAELIDDADDLGIDVGEAYGFLEEEQDQQWD